MSGGPRRVVVLATHVHGGGAQLVANTMAEELSARGHEVELWFLYQKDETFRSRVRWRVLLPAARLGVLGPVRVLARLVGELRRSRPHAVISNLPLANVLGQAAARVAGVPVRAAVQHTEWWTYKWPMQVADRAAGTLGCYSANVAVSQAVARSFANHPARYRRALQVIPNGIRFEPSALPRRAAREHFGLPSDAPLVIAIGRLSEQKNHAVLLQALAGRGDAHLAIAGDGELRPALERLGRELGLGGRLHLLGNIPRHDVAILMRAADLWAFPSLFEGLSLSLLEAVNAGLPLIASDIPPNVEVLTAGGEAEPAAVLLPPGDREAWARELGRLLADADLRARYAERARALAPLFTLERMIDGYERLIAAP